MPLLKRNRPVEVKILAAIFVWLAIWNVLRFLQAFHFSVTLSEYGAGYSSLYLLVSGGVWAGVGLNLAWILWQGKPWAWGATLGGAAGYGSWVWFDRLFVQEQHTNGTFAVAGAIAGLVIIFLLFFSKHVRDFYHER